MAWMIESFLKDVLVNLNEQGYRIDALADPRPLGTEGGAWRVSLHSPAGTEVVLHDGLPNNSDDNLVRTFTAATTPALSTLAGQPAAGSWRLKVVDRAAQDQGKLISWRVLIKPPQT